MGDADAVAPVQVQRLAARALLRRGDEIVLARIAGAGYGTAGTWTLPGGGVDHGEHPETPYVARSGEVTGLDVEPGPVIGVLSRRFIGAVTPRRAGGLHAVHLIFAAAVTSTHVLRPGLAAAEVVRYALTAAEVAGFAFSQQGSNLDYMITSRGQTIQAWFAGRLPAAWTGITAKIEVDREEIAVIITLEPVDLGDGAEPAEQAEAAAGRMSAWREETRRERMAIAREAEGRFERKVAWGAAIGDHTALFTHLAVPVMTRLRQPQRQVLDTLIEAGVARSRADALKWCVRLVGEHSEEWLNELRAAMENVRAVRDQGPA